MSEVLIIQLSRLGDLIQSNHMLVEWKAASPGTQFDVLTLQESSAALTGLPLRNLFLIPSPQWKAMEDDLSKGRFDEAARRGADILKNLPLPHYQRVVNIDFVYASCWFSMHIQTDSRRGGQLDAQGRRFYDDWGSFFRAVALHQNAGQLNIVDLFRSIARTGYIPRADARPPLASASRLPFELPAGRRIALNPGANEAWRRWPAEKFVDLAQRLHADGWTPMLVGSAGDRELCHSIVERCPVPLADFSGCTSVPEMVALLRQTELLISNDTGAVHLSAAAGTPVLGLYERIPYLFTTAPWSSRNLVLYCPDPAIELSPALVRLAALERLQQAGREELQHELDAAGVEGWETSFLPPGVDPLGGLICLPLHRRGQPAYRLFAFVIRHLMAQHLCGGGPVHLQYLQQLVATGAIPLHEEFAGQFAALQRLVEGYTEALQGFAQRAARAHTAAADGDTVFMRHQAGLLSAELNALPAVPPECPPLQLLMAYLGQKLQQFQHLPLIEILRLYQKECHHTALLLSEGLRLTAMLVPAAGRPATASR